MGIFNKLFSLLIILFLFFFFGQVTYAATITVNTTVDELNTNGNCSLREGIQAANTNSLVDACLAGSGTDTIILPAGTYTLGIAGTGEDANATGDLDVTGGLIINGAGAVSTIIDGGSIDRVLEVRPGADVQVNGITIRNGNPGAGFGAAGILNSGTLTLTKSTVTNNTGDNFGGGIYNVGTMTLTDTTVSDNILLGSNLSGGGGGIFSSGTMTLTRTTVSGNSTIGRGGGIYNLDQTATITNSTISTNTALNGGGIFNRDGTVNLTHNTITSNIAADNGGGVWNYSGTMRFANTIIAGNTAATPADDCAGGMSSLGYNLASDATCSLGGIGDLNSTNPLLGPLANNGGLTKTHALLAGSPAIDAVPLVSCAVSTDQRGILRPQGAACDIGAFELLLIVPIDIKPGSFPNSINPKSKGKIPVAILSTITFDAPSQLDKTSLTFGKTGNETSLAFCNKSAKDVNADGFLDQVCHFNTQLTGFQLGDTLGILKGQTVGGTPINASDSVRIIN